MSCWILKRNSMLVKCLHQKPIDKSTTLNLVIRALVFTCHRHLGFFRWTWRRMRLSRELRADPRSLVKPPRPPRQPAASPPGATGATTVTACGKMTCVTGMKIGRGGAKWYRRGHFTQRSFQEVSHQDAKGGRGGWKKKQKRWPFYSRPKRSNQAWRALQKTISPN